MDGVLHVGRDTTLPLNTDRIARVIREVGLHDEGRRPMMKCR